MNQATAEATEAVAALIEQDEAQSAVDTFNNIVKPATMVEENPELFKDSQMNWWLKSRDRNGLSEAGAVLKIGHKLYLHRERFIRWFISHVEAA